MVTGNRLPSLQRAITSCLGQTPPPGGMTFCIVDNSSTDGTREWLRDWAARAPVPVKLVLNPANLGPGDSKSLGFASTTAPLVFFLDDDVEITSAPDTLLRMLEAFEVQPRLGLLALATADAHIPDYYPNHRHGDPLFQYIGTALMLRRDAVRDLPLYPAGLGYGGEELYAALGIHGGGYEIRYWAKGQCIHTHGTANRASHRENCINNLANCWVIRQLRMPRMFQPFCFLLFIIRIVKTFGWRAMPLGEIMGRVRARYRPECRRPISWKSSLRLLRRHGKNVL